MKTTFIQTKLWPFLCSLKLAIVLASAATLVVMAGSLLILSKPELFAMMDSMTLGLWFNQVANRSPLLTGWVPLAGLLLGLLFLNTLCCFIDWALAIRSRWRKSGEYLIHLGFILLVVAYFWGSMAGFRSEGNQVFVGQTVALKLPGMYLRLEAFQPIIGQSGRPMDMLNSLVLLKGDTEVARAQVRINHPLTWQGLVVLPASFGRTFAGYQPAGPGGARGEPVYKTYSLLTANYDPGAGLALAGGIAMGAGVLLALVSFYRKRARGERPEID